MDLVEFTIFFGGIAALFFWSRSESRADQRQMLSIIQSIQDEIKDFHGRLERQDAELKAYIMHSNDQRNKGK